MFNFAAHRRPEHYRLIVERVGAEVTPANDIKVTKEPSMFVLQVNLRIKPENVERFMKKALENAREARKEPGCKQFDVLVDPKDKTQVMLYEIYNDEQAFETHQQTPHFKKYVAEAVPLLASRERQVWKRA